MVGIKQQFVPASKKQVTRGKNRKRGVTVHDTANTSAGAHAQAHANLQYNGNPRRASWHYQVDDKEAIQSYRHNDRTWHSNTPEGNRDRISVEICINSDGDYKKAVQNAAELVAFILDYEGKSLNDVDQHNNYNGAECPRQLRNSRDGISWNDFLGMVGESLTGEKRSGGSSSSSSGSSSSKTVAQLAQEVIDGRHGTGDARKRALGSQYQAVQNEVNRRLGVGGTTSSGSSRKSAQQVAQDIANGRGGWGNDPQRRQKLSNAGYDASDVQNRVNRILGASASSSSSSRLSVDQVARQIINGQGGWGNDPERSQRLRAAGYNPQTVQNRVNQLL